MALRRTIRLLAIAAVLAAVAAPSAGAASGAAARARAASEDCPNAATLPSHLAIAEAQAATLCLMNAQRTARGLRSLRPELTLARVATGFAQLMADQRFFDHTSPGGSTLLSRVRAANYLSGAAAWNIGENIAWGTGGLSTPRAMVQAWMKSPPHRENLLAPRFAEVGIGIASGGASADVNPRGRGTTYVTDFGKRVLRAHAAKHSR